MKKLLLLAIFASTLGMNAAQAATATGNFNVTITLTSACKVNTAPTASFAYTSLQTMATTMTASSFTMTCTNSLPISSVVLDGSGSGGTYSYTDQATNLAYTLTLTGVPTTGSGSAQTVNLTGSMAANQAGTCNAASCANTSSTNRQRTITVTY